GFLTMQRLEDDDVIYEMEEAPAQSFTPNVQQASLLEKGQKKIKVEAEIVEVVEVVEELTEETPEVVEEEFKGIPEPVTKQSEKESIVHQEEIVIPLPATVETSQGFDIRFPPGKLEDILRSIDTTPHEGYKPVIGFNSNGQIVIDWVTA
ncbi:MAG: hypothetical protein ACKVHC_00460, partial [Candidatus Poseidoniales archaeon]